MTDKEMSANEARAAFYAAFAKAQGQIEGALKDSTNPHFKSKFADLGAVWDACRKPLSDNGIAVIQRPATGTEDGRMMVSIQTVLCHASGHTEEFPPLILPVSKPDAQGIGSAITYGRRYALMAAVGIAPEDDDGNAAAKAPPKQEQRQQKPQETDAEAIERAKEYLAEADSLDDLKERWGRIPKPVQANADVIAAKDAAKERLSKPIIDDEIPY